MKKAIIFIAALFIIFSFSFSQSQKGSLYGVVKTKAGSPVPGAVVSLIGSGRYQPVFTDQQGRFKFPNLPPGEYDLIVELESFDTKEDKVMINPNRNTNKVIEMEKLEEITIVTSGQATISSNDPEQKQQSYFPYANKNPSIRSAGKAGKYVVNNDFLESIPTARDPWSIVQLVPGVLADRVDVGGSESILQTNYMGPGSSGNYNQYYFDGFQMTDSLNTFTPPAYISPDLVEDIHITTGGAGAQSQTNGAIINIHPKKGTNHFHGSVTARSQLFNFPKGDISTPSFYKEGEWNPPDSTRNVYTAFNYGGPILKDKLWFFGSFGGHLKKGTTEYGLEDISFQSTGFFKLDTDFNTKWGNGQGTMNFFFDGKNGETGYWPGQQFLQTPSDQKDRFNFLSGKIDHSFGELTLNVDINYRWSLFELDPLGAEISSKGDHFEGNESQLIFDADGGLTFNGPGFYQQTDRNFFNVNLDGNYFLDGALGGDHEIRFGIDYFTANSIDMSKAPNQRLAYVYPNSPSLNSLTVFPDHLEDVNLTRTSVYIEDIINWKNLSGNFGLRYDSEQGRINPFDQPNFTWYEPGSPFHGEIMAFPPLSLIKPFNVPNSWELISPRVSLNYDITGDGKHVVRVSAGRYMQQSNESFFNPYFPQRYADLGWNDSNTDGIPQYGELGALIYQYPQYPIYSWPSVGPPNVEWDTDFKTPYLCEWILGYEWNFLDIYTFDINYKRTRTHNQAYTVGQTGGIVPVNRGIFLDGTLEGKDNWEYLGDFPVGDTIVPFYTRIQDPFGWYYYNLDDTYDVYKALQFRFSKSLYNDWMINGSFTLSNWKRFLDEDERLNMNNYDYFDEGAAFYTFPQSQIPGIYVNSRWQFKVSGLTQLAWGINVTGLFQAREGYIIPYHETYRFKQGYQNMYEGKKKAGDDRLPTFWMLNLGLEKTFKVSDTTTCTLFVDGYNITNNKTTLQVNPLIGSTQGDIERIFNPGLFQFSVRVSF